IDEALECKLRPLALALPLLVAHARVVTPRSRRREAGDAPPDSSSRLEVTESDASACETIYVTPAFRRGPEVTTRQASYFEATAPAFEPKAPFFHFCLRRRIREPSRSQPKQRRTARCTIASRTKP